jgi:hypothetical protein
MPAPSRRRVTVRHRAALSPAAVVLRMNGRKMRHPIQPLDDLTTRLLRCEGGHAYGRDFERPALEELRRILDAPVLASERRWNRGSPSHANRQVARRVTSTDTKMQSRTAPGIA